ncbi:MAG: AmmeMemoRadiSam system protein A [Armatimonadota bacterium]|nr:AmmeMemoRadiSam system protein A [Armatimonadota bacterium]
MSEDERSFHVDLAMRAIEAYLSSRKILEPPGELPMELCGQAGAFVSLKKFGQLRGCIGTIGPTQPNIALEIIHNGISAATRDPRFDPVCPEELPLLSCSVDVLMPPEPVNDVCELDPLTYGVIVEHGYRRGLLLPNLEGVDTVDYQIEIACRKASIRPDDPFKLYRFEVKRYY